MVLFDIGLSWLLWLPDIYHHIEEVLQVGKQNNQKKITTNFNTERKLVYKTTMYPKIDRHETDIYIHTREGDRLDNIAYEYYKDASQWWVLAQANHLGKGSLHVPPGIRLRIPSQRELFKILTENEQDR